MGLNIRLLHGDKCVINGAVISCKSQRTTISVENYAQVIRAPDILDTDNVKTPTQHVYFAVQLMLIDAEGRETHRAYFHSVLSQLLTAYENPEIIDFLLEAADLVAQRDYYQALRKLKPVLAYEGRILGRGDEARASAVVACEATP